MEELLASHNGTPNDVRNFPSSSSRSSSNGGSSRSKSIPISSSSYRFNDATSSEAASNEQSEQEALAEYRDYVMLRRIQEGQQRRLQQYKTTSTNHSNSMNLAELMYAHQSFLVQGTHVEEEFRLARSEPQLLPEQPRLVELTSHRPVIPTVESTQFHHESEQDEDDGIFDMDL